MKAIVPITLTLLLLAIFLILTPYLTLFQDIFTTESDSEDEPLDFE
jgi:hypothetical protein